MKILLQTAVVTLGLSLIVAAPAQAQGSAGQQGTPGNALNPGNSERGVPSDPEGTGIVVGSRSPTGLLTVAPTLEKAASTTASGLRYRAKIEFGASGLSGDEHAAKFREYKDLPSGAYPNNFAVSIEKPKSAFHFDGVGGGVTKNDQYYGFDVGKYNTWRVRGSFSEVPHFFTSTYDSLWSGVGTSTLTLSRLVPGGTTNANTTQAAMQSVIASTSQGDVDLTRQKSRTRVDLTLPSNWKAYASYTRERRDGSRPFGAVFGGGGGGGNLEIPESIDYNTQDVLAGVQFAGTQTNLTVQTTASFFHNDIDTLTFENPLFITTNTIAGVPSTTFTRGQFDLYPNNRAYNVRGEIVQKLPHFLKSRVTGVFAGGQMRQNDALIPPALEPLTGGTINGVSTTGVWNTTNALSQTTADRQIGTRLADVGIVMNPSRDFTVRGKVRYYGTNNESSDYVACNPLTGQWGRLLNNGSGGSFVTPNTAAGNNPPGTLNTGYNGTACNLAATRALGLAPNVGDVPIRSAPYEYSQTNSVVSTDFRLARSSSLEAAFERENFSRPYREREKTWENKVRFAYVNRGFDSGTLRVSYEYGHRRGGDFVAAPLADFYSGSLGPAPVANGTNMTTFVRNVDQLRRFDVADRNQNIFNVRFNHGIGSMLDASVGVQVRDLDYPASEYGSNQQQRLTTPSFELDWQMSATSNAYGFYSLQTGHLQQAGVQTTGTCTIGNSGVVASNFSSLCATASATSPLFPISRTWDVSQKDHNGAGGLGFRYELGRVMTEVAYTYTKGRTGVTYEYDPTALGINATQAALAGNGFSDLLFEQHICEATAVVPIAPRLSLRLLYWYERGKIHDWHYDGIDVNPMPANNGAYLDVGAQSYKTHWFGALFRFDL
jgi:hypothetical protein